MEIYRLWIFIIVSSFVPSLSKTVINSGLINTQLLQNSDGYRGSYMESDTLEQEGADLDRIERSIQNIDAKLCSLVCGTYCCQFLVINTMFTLLSNVSQWLQKELDVDTSSMFAGKFYGFLTVTFGSYVSYKLSELIVDLILKIFKHFDFVNDIRDVINPLKPNLSCINVPILLLYRVSKHLHNQIPLRLGSLDIRIKNKLNEGDAGSDEVNGDLKISVRGKSLNTSKFKRELAVIATYGLGTFLVLGGRLQSFTPSELRHPGAYAEPKLSLEAEGYDYASKCQKRLIQTIGRKYGCHSCGMISRRERYIADHQPPNGLVKRKLSGKCISFLLKYRLIPLRFVRPKQYFYPQCNECSMKQSRAVANNRRESVTHYGRFRSYHLCPTTFFVSRVLFDTKWSKLNLKVK